MDARAEDNEDATRGRVEREHELQRGDRGRHRHHPRELPPAPSCSSNERAKPRFSESVRLQEAVGDVARHHRDVRQEVPLEDELERLGSFHHQEVDLLGSVPLLVQREQRVLVGRPGEAVESSVFPVDLHRVLRATPDPMGERGAELVHPGRLGRVGVEDHDRLPLGRCCRTGGDRGEHEGGNGRAHGRPVPHVPGAAARARDPDQWTSARPG